MARPVTLRQRQNGWILITIVGYAIAEKDYSGARKVLADLGFRMTRAPQHLQPVLQQWVMTLYRLEQANLCGGPLQPSPYANQEITCMACESARSAGAEAYVDAVGALPKDMYRCKCCLGTWHSGCAALRGVRAEVDEPFTCPMCN